MMKIELKTGGAAFCNPHTGEPDKYYEKQEVIRLLNEIRLDIDDGDTYGSIMDINGNKIGEWSLD